MVINAVRQVEHNKTADDADDESLVAGIALKDQKALARLYQRYSNKLYAFAFKMLQNQQECEEVLQDVFVRIWNRAGDFRPEKASVFSWAIMMTRSLAIDRLRARNRKIRVLDRFEQLAEEPSWMSDSGSGIGIPSELTRRISEALDRLPQDQLESVELAFFKGLTQWEIAQKTQQPLGTIKSRIRRGMLRLRELLRDVYA